MFNYIQSLDNRTFLNLFNPVDNPQLTKCSLILSFTADGWFYFSLIPILTLARPNEFREYFFLATLVFLTERILYFILKNSFKRRRPPQALPGINPVISASDRFSLPSGHTSAAFLFATFLSLAISPLFLPLFGWAASVGASRVILGVHFPSDVILGALMGTSVAFILI